MAKLAPGLIAHDGHVRCFWCGEQPDYQAYHERWKAESGYLVRN